MRYQAWRTSGGNLPRCTRTSGKLLASCKLNSVRPKRLLKKLIFVKKAICPVEEKFWPFFYLSIEHDNGEGSVYKCPHGLLTFFMQVIGLFLWHLRNQETNISKKPIFLGTIYLALLSRNIECKESQATICKGTQAVLTPTVEDIRSFL